MALRGPEPPRFKFDGERFRQEARKLGCPAITDIAHAARVSARTVHRTIAGDELPSRRLILWMVECGVDLRRVWVNA